jgi:hypothetical protein
MRVRHKKGTTHGVRLVPKDEVRVFDYINEEQISFAEFARYAIRKELEVVFPKKQEQENEYE